MKKIIKGKSYIFFGNFPNCEDVAKKLSEQLDIEAKAFLSQTDSTSVVEYCETDEELELLQEENKKLKQQLEYYKQNYKKKLF